MPSPRARSSAPHRLPVFTLDDQFGRLVDDATYRGVPLIVVAGSREGAPGVALWTASLRLAIGDSSDTCVLPVADLGGVPRILRRTVSRLLPRDPEHWCALDWEGQLCTSVREAGSTLCAAAFDARGVLRLVRSLPREAVDRETLVQLVEAAMSTRE
jgi:hypothetical protein